MEIIHSDFPAAFIAGGDRHRRRRWPCARRAESFAHTRTMDSMFIQFINLLPYTLLRSELCSMCVSRVAVDGPKTIE